MALLPMTYFLVILVIITLAMVVGIESVSSTSTGNYGELSYENIASEKDIPHTVPVGTHTVCLKRSEKIRILDDSPFCSVSWENVSELYISDFPVLSYINKDFLVGLRGLKLLSISYCQNLNSMPDELLKETPELEALYLDWLPSVTISQVEKLLLHSVPNLRYLSLIATNRRMSEPYIMGDNFLRVVGPKNLTFLDLSLSYFGGFRDLEINFPTKLLYLNLSYTPFVTTPPNFPNNSFLHLEALDLSGCYRNLFGGMDPIPKHPVRVIKFDYCPSFEQTMYFFSGDLKVVSDDFIELDVNWTYTNSEGCRVQNIRLIDWSKNRIKRLNLSIAGSYIFVDLRQLDLSDNGMEYLSPSGLSAFSALKIINLDGNALGKMENNNDFENLFTSLKIIEIIYLKDNGLTRLPVNLGHQNKELRILDLKGNHLRQFEMPVGRMEKLILIDLSNNYINVLTNKFIEEMQHVRGIQQSSNYINGTWSRERHNLYSLQKNCIRMAYAYNSTRDERLFAEENDWFPERFSIDISGNPLQCSCDNVYFPKWIFSSDVNLREKESLKCMFQGKELDINSDIIRTIEFKCTLPRTIGIIATVCILCFVIVFLSFYIRKRQRNKVRRKDRIKHLKREIRERKMSYIVFVSCSSKDQDITDKYIIPVINNYLKEKLETKEDLAVTGLETIIPGMMLENEIHRCIEGALVVVLVVTDHFLESNWCKLEGLIANQYNIPLAILIEDSTRCESESKTINHALKRFGRAEWSTTNGEFKIRPAWNVICEGILRIAAVSLSEQNKKEQTKIRIEQEALIENDDVELTLI